MTDPYGEAGGPSSRPTPTVYESTELILVDDPLPAVRRVTLNRPEKRNALNNQLRGELIHALQVADSDPEIKVMVIRGAGSCFSAGYDLGDGNVGRPLPHFTAPGEGLWPRHVTETWMGIWDLSKPVIAQVHGYCLAGASELVTGCDLVYMAEDALMGYPAVRFGVPDMQFHAWMLGMRAAMEMMLTGDPIDGVEAARLGWANRAVPAGELEEYVLSMAERIARLPSDIASLNKRAVHRQMEVMGLRTGIRQGTELCSLAIHQQSFGDFIETVRSEGLTSALDERDQPFGDYRSGAAGR